MGEKKMNSKKHSENDAKSTATAAMMAKKIAVAQKKAAEKKQKELEKAGTAPPPDGQPIWGATCPKPPTAEQFEAALPEKMKDFEQVMAERMKTALIALDGDAKKKARF